MTIDGLSELLDISPGFLFANEKGARNMSISKLIKMSELFHVTLDYLILGVGENPADRPHNLIDFFQNILTGEETDMLIGLAEAMSVNKYSAEELRMIGDTLSLQMKLINSLREEKKQG
ncbi:MAG: helix-turn-helix domain-containing protein [Defluviitaleaceae bacterium]|nr:helix-turn-helix domain-containing protein [Defluviitaleaceae bacterium]